MFNITNLLFKNYLLLSIQIGAPIKETIVAKALINISGMWNLLAHKSSLWYVLLCTDTPALLTGPEELKLCPEENIQTRCDPEHKNLSYVVLCKNE